MGSTGAVALLAVAAAHVAEGLETDASFEILNEGYADGCGAAAADAGTALAQGHSLGYC